MANTILTESIIAKEMMVQLENNLVMGANVHTQYKKEFVNPRPGAGGKPGSSISIRKPVKYRVKDGATLDVVDTLERAHTLTVDSRKHVALNFTTEEYTLSIEEFSARHIKAAAIALANQVDADLCALYAKVYNQVGTPGTTPDSFAEVTPAAQRLDEEAVPTNDRKIVANPACTWGIAQGISGLYNPKMVSGAVRRGSIGEFAGFGSVWMDQNIKAHTVGYHDTGSTPVVTATIPTEGVVVLNTDGWANSTAVLLAGDVITVAGCYAVNPVSGAVLPWLRQFVVLADVTSSGAGLATLSVSPGFVSASAAEALLPYQTVDALPVEDAAVTVVGTESTIYPMNLAFHRDAFALVTCPLVIPRSAAWSERITKNNISIRGVADYDSTNDLEILRFDILYGVDCIYPELACRLVG